MRKMAISLLAGGLLAAAGCPAPPPPPASPRPALKTHRASRDGLVVELVLPGYSFVCGQDLPVKVIAHNHSERDMVFRADSGALAHVRLWRRATGGWEELHRFPETAVLIATSWTLKAAQTRTFPLNLQVAPDWPTHEPLRLTGELNGCPGLTPSALIDVYADQAAGSPAGQ